jgi:hypothetical protein
MLVPLNVPVVIEDEKKEPEPYLLWLPESSRYPSSGNCVAIGNPNALILPLLFKQD